MVSDIESLFGNKRTSRFAGGLPYAGHSEAATYFVRSLRWSLGLAGARVEGKHWRHLQSNAGKYKPMN